MSFRLANISIAYRNNINILLNIHLLLHKKPLIGIPWTCCWSFWVSHCVSLFVLCSFHFCFGFLLRSVYNMFIILVLSGLSQHNFFLLVFQFFLWFFFRIFFWFSFNTNSGQVAKHIWVYIDILFHTSILMHMLECLN